MTNESQDTIDEQNELSGFSVDDTDAEKRADEYQDLDPFPEVPEALLSSEHIHEYVKKTGMLWPFRPQKKEKSLKSASYEARPGKYFIHWDETGEKIVHKISIDEKKPLELPANSITFIQIEPKIRLPNYIAIRFNLRITHVHRGLLLGTGPLIDPGYRGDILIPLHNLTSKPYIIKSNEGLIWMEFTKTSHDCKPKEAAAKHEFPSFRGIEKSKVNVGHEYYFERANGNRPIQSSIPQGIKDSRKEATDAANSAKESANSVKEMKRVGRIFAGIGAVGVLAVGIALHQYFNQINALVIDANSIAGAVRERVALVEADAKEREISAQELKSALSTAKGEIEGLRAQIDFLSSELDAVNRQLQSNSPP